MLDMGFLPDIKRILDALPKKRQTLLFSATMSPTIRKLANEILNDPVVVTVDRQAPHLAIVQTLHPVSQERKCALLTKLLKQPDMDSVLVFVRRKLDVNRVASSVRRVGIDAGSIHSGRTQEERIKALDDFRSGRTPVLVATDVAARGLDVTGISHVINFDVPHSPEDYIHRAGRTARAGATGDVITFVAPDEEERLREIQRVIGMELPRTFLPGFESGHTGEAPTGRHRAPRGGAPRGGESRGGESRGHAPRGRAPRGDAPREGAPRGDAPREDAPREGAPHEDTPRGDAPRGNAPRGNAPRREAPRTDILYVEAPDDGPADTQAPRSEDGGAPRRRRRRGGRGRSAGAPAAAV